MSPLHHPWSGWIVIHRTRGPIWVIDLFGLIPRSPLTNVGVSDGQSDQYSSWPHGRFSWARSSTLGTSSLVPGYLSRPPISVR